jgi:hypothetical protein
MQALIYIVLSADRVCKTGRTRIGARARMCGRPLHSDRILRHRLPKDSTYPSGWLRNYFLHVTTGRPDTQ